MDDKKKSNPPKWAHKQRVAPDNLIKGLKALQFGIEQVIAEEEKKLLEYQAILANFKKPK